jgi:poly(3-hydroxybutyrate) depolymerase
MLLRTVVAVFLLQTAAARAAPDPPALAAQGADAKQTSVSGLSAGAYMAVQLQVAYSASIVGAGIIAGGPFYCAADNSLFVSLCMGQVAFFMPGASSSVGTAKGYEITHAIDALSHLRQRRLYIFSGSLDSVVRPAAVAAAVEFIRRLGVAERGIAYVRDVPAGRDSRRAPLTAATPATPINRCDVDGVRTTGEGVLTQSTDRSVRREPSRRAGARPASLRRCDGRDGRHGLRLRSGSCAVAGAHCRCTSRCTAACKPSRCTTRFTAAPATAAGP